ncbi:MAG: hypothetical protein MJ160_07160 [Treponema sp.]|nr:hypothetical protein [Treponema sp.]
MVKNALIHVERNENILEFAKFLVDTGWTILTANKTEELFKREQIPFTHEPSLTESTLHIGDPSYLIKTLLSTKYIDEEKALEAPFPTATGINIVCVNLMPCMKDTLTQQQVPEYTKQFNFYISTLLRNSFVNYENILILTDPADYKEAMIQLRTNNITKEFRVYLAAKALNLISAFDSGIANTLLQNSEFTTDFTNYLAFPLVKQKTLDGGSNKHQQSCLYGYPSDSGAVSGIRKLHEKIDYNTIADVSLAWETISSIYKNLKNQFSVQSTNCDGYNFATQFTPLMGIVFCIAVKYKSILGAALSSNVSESFQKTYCFNSELIDDVVIGCSSVIDGQAAEKMADKKIVAIVAPDFTEEAKQIFEKTNIKLITTAKINCSPYSIDILNGGLLFQTKDATLFDHWNVVTKNRPAQNIIDEMAFGILLAMGARTYSALLLKNNQLVGISQCSKSAVHAVRNVTIEAQDLNPDPQDGVLAELLVCDTAVPLCQSIKELIDKGVKAIIQTGGTSSDDEFINYCNEHDVTMVFTEMSHITL